MDAMRFEDIHLTYNINFAAPQSMHQFWLGKLNFKKSILIMLRIAEEQQD